MAKTVYLAAGIIAGSRGLSFKVATGFGIGSSSFVSRTGYCLNSWTLISAIGCYLTPDCKPELATDEKALCCLAETVLGPVF